MYVCMYVCLYVYILTLYTYISFIYDLQNVYDCIRYDKKWFLTPLSFRSISWRLFHLLFPILLVPKHWSKATSRPTTTELFLKFSKYFFIAQPLQKVEACNMLTVFSLSYLYCHNTVLNDKNMSNIYGRKVAWATIYKTSLKHFKIKITRMISLL